jgi:hypothetical protein
MGKRCWIIVELRPRPSKSFDNACGSSSQAQQAIDPPIPPAHDTKALSTRIAKKKKPNSTVPEWPTQQIQLRSRATPIAPPLAPPSFLRFCPCSNAPVGFLRSLVVVLALALTSPSTRSLTWSSIQNSTSQCDNSPVFIPSCLDLVVRLSFPYRHRQSRHSLRDNPTTNINYRFLIPLSNRAYSNPQPFLETGSTFIPHTFYFTTSLRTKSLA